jgi:D-2-hydroxyglutarate dehydrogenase
VNCYLSLCFLCLQKLLVEAKRNLGEILSAFEFLDNNSMDLVSF